MATVIKRVNYWTKSDNHYHPETNTEGVRAKPGYFIKWTKFTLTETRGEATITTEIELAIIADADTGQTFPVKSENFVVDLSDFIKTNKIESWEKG